MSALNDTPKPRIPDSVDLQRLQAMQLVAKMKESADRHGIGFVGGFISPDGQKFMMTNMDEADTQMLLPDDLRWTMTNADALVICVAIICATIIVIKRS